MSANIQKAQAIKDATMAHFILKNHSEGKTFLHFNGSYHSERYQGAVWYVKEYNKRTEYPLNILTISSVDQKSLKALEDGNLGLADFIICVPEDMTKTQVPFFMPPPATPMIGAAKDQPLIKADTSAQPADTNEVEGEERDLD